MGSLVYEFPSYFRPFIMSTFALISGDGLTDGIEQLRRKTWIQSMNSSNPCLDS